MNYPHTSTEGQVMGIIGIVLGILSLVVAFIPCIGIVAIFPGMLAIVFSVISISQATRGNGKKGLGIVSLIISVASVVIALLWILVINGTAIVADRVFNKSDKIQIFGKEFKDAFDKEMGDDIDRKALSDSLVKALKQLEMEMEKLDSLNAPDREAARKAGEAAAKALKKTAEGLKKAKAKADSLKYPK